MTAPAPPKPRRPRLRRVPGVLTRPPLRGPRPQRHQVARDAVAAAGRLPGPADLSEAELRCTYDHLDEDLRALPGPDEATDAVVHAFGCWLSRQDRSTREAVTAVRAQREDLARAGRVLERMRSGEAFIGTLQARRIEDLAALAPLYRGARRGPAAAEQAPGTGQGDAGEDVGAVFAAQADAVAAAGLDDLVAELAPALGWSEYTAAAQVLLAARVVAVMPHALDRLAAGQLSMAALTATAGRLAEVDDVVAGTIEEHLFGPEGEGMGVGVGLTRASLRAEVDHQVQLHDPAAAVRRVRRKTCARKVCCTPLGDGQAKLTLIGPVTAVAGVAKTVDAAARANLAAAKDAARQGLPAPGGGDPYAEPATSAEPGEVVRDERTLGAHAFDAAITALSSVRPGALDASSAGWAAGTSVEIRISLPSLVGVDDDPGYVEGYGWVPAWLVRQQLRWSGCRLRRVLTDPFTGDLVAVDGHWGHLPLAGDYPASWLTDPDSGPEPGTEPGPGGGGPGGGGPGGGGGGGSSGPAPQPPPASARPGLFKGRPIQQLAVTPDDTGTDTNTDDLDEAVDACAAGTCEPGDPAACPLHVIGGGPHDPPEALRRHVTALWGTSTGPGDALPAHKVDLDHVTAWGQLPGQGGSTCGCNLDPKSRRWHRRKRAGDPRSAAQRSWTARWQHWRCTAGHAHWRSPLRLDHVTRPRPYTDPIPLYRPWAPPPRGQTPAAPADTTARPASRFPAQPPF